jgi:hypothetical protein
MDGRERRQLVREREQHRIETAEAGARLELDSRGMEDSHPGGRSHGRRGVRELGLSHAGLARQEEGTAIRPGGIHKCAKATDVRVPTHELTGWPTVARPFGLLGEWAVKHGHRRLRRPCQGGLPVWTSHMQSATPVGACFESSDPRPRGTRRRTIALSARDGSRDGERTISSRQRVKPAR